MESHSYRFKFYHYRMPCLEHCHDDIMLYTKPQDIKKFVLDNAVRYFRHGKNDFEPYTYGGVTECVVYDDEDIVMETRSVCSLSDHFSYKRGVEISKGRALKGLKYANK